MKKTVLYIIIVALLALGVWFINSNQTITIEESPVTIHPISHASFVLEWGDVLIYADPVGGEDLYEGYSDPNIILITHTHGDHLDIETLSSIIGENSTIVAPQTVADELNESLLSQTIILSNDEDLSEQGFNISAIPMYNIPESEDAYHVKGDGNGYVIESNDYRIYIAGDTSGVPEMRSLENINTAFIPMNLPYTMDIDEAADAVLDFQPNTVYPYHYRGTEGFSDVESFKNMVESENSDIEVILGDWYPEN